MAAAGNAAMKKWLIIGTACQLIMVISGHNNQFIAENVFALGGMAISLIAGAGYAIGARAGRALAVRGGAIVGGGCALIGILVSVALGDVPALILALGTLSSTLAGAIGGLGASFIGGGAATST